MIQIGFTYRPVQLQTYGVMGGSLRGVRLHFYSKSAPSTQKKIPKSHTPGLDVNLWESRNSSQLPSTQDNASWLPKSHPRVGRAPTVLVRYPEVNQVDNTHLQSKNDGEILPTALSLCSHQSTGTQYGSYRPFGESQLARGVHGVLGFSSTCG
jgi:hypothetical protein